MEQYLGMKWADARPLLEQAGIAYRTRLAQPNRPRREEPKGPLAERIVRISVKDDQWEIILSQVPDPLQAS